MNRILWIITLMFVAVAAKADSQDASDRLGSRLSSQSVCEVHYALAPGERLVALCNNAPIKPSRIVIVESGSEHVDAGLIKRLRFSNVIYLTNRSTEPVLGTAIVSTF